MLQFSVANLLACFQILTIFCCNSTCVLSDSDLLHLLLKMPALDRNEKLACDNCGTQVSKKNLTRHKKRCSAGTVFCSQCPNYSTKSHNDLNCHIAKKHGAPKPAVAHICMICKDKFTGFYALRQHKSQVHGHILNQVSILLPSLLVSTMTVSRKNYVPVNISLLIRNWKKDVREFSISHWILLVLKKSTQSWIMYFNSSNVLQKLI